MRNYIELAGGAFCVVLALIAFRAAFDRASGRAAWAQKCLLILAVVAALAGIMQGLAVSGRGGLYVRPWRAAHMATSLRGISLGLLVALVLSGQFTARKPPEH